MLIDQIRKQVELTFDEFIRGPLSKWHQTQHNEAPNNIKAPPHPGEMLQRMMGRTTLPNLLLGVVLFRVTIA